MKKITLLVLSLLLALLLFGCENQTDNPPETNAPETTAPDITRNNSSGTESPETNAPETTADTKETPNTGKPNVDLIELNNVLKDVLYNKRTFIDESGNAVYLKDHKFVLDGSNMPVIEYTTVDMNNDGEKELVINVGPEGNQTFVMVFRIYNGNVYGYQFGIRSLHSIKTDGSYWASSSAFEGSILKLEFEGTSYKEVEIAYHNTTDNVYRINGVNATKEEYDAFTVQKGQQNVVWIDWKSQEADTDYSDHEFYIDLNFDSKLDKLVPHERSAYAVFYKAYVWNEAKGDYIYAPSFELFPNVSIDTERKVLLAHFSGGMTTSYSMFTYNGEDFESIHSLYWSFVENGKTQLKEQEYVVETGSSERKTLERKNINIDKDYLQLDKTDEQLKGYFEVGSFWDLDGAKWKNYVFNMDNSDWWKF